MLSIIAQLQAAISTNPPTHTSNPFVNWLVDCATTGEVLEYDMQMYRDEIEAFKLVGKERG